ncbi:hydrophobin [Schizophyllum amplum]|uniref:Hydrophobin n=1 Tax=Schizophyllum amplum TaxID=97359 RepID=A0A550CPK2_9AGAR|nr:hydrophobin [Auriculariopsis ampla]
MRFFSALVLALPALAIAGAVPRGAETGKPASCSGGGVYCCNKTTKTTDKSIQGLLAGVGVVVKNIHDLVGLNCSPITAIGVGGTKCTAQTVCCSDTYQNGLVNVNCVPINIL